MSSVSQTNPGVAALLQMLSNSGSSALSSALSSPSVASALQKASPSDLVVLSQQAMQLNETGLLFGSTDTTEASSDPLAALFGTTDSSSTDANSLLASLEASLAASASSSSATAASSSATTASQLSAAIDAMRAQEMQTLFGTDSTTTTTSSSLLDMLA